MNVFEIAHFIDVMWWPGIALGAAVICVIGAWLLRSTSDGDRLDWPRDDWRQP